jgi:eukaryotic-like serine/threonine-protein kinase
MIGHTIDGRCRILRELGKGGMGVVYEAEHVGTGRRVAVKVINAEMAQQDEMVRRFQREARAAGSIETPHIVHVSDTGTDATSGVIFMVMELLRGEDLQQLLRRLGKLPPLLSLRLVGQACIGLDKAHEAGVIHRDLKPANLFLSRHDNGDVTVKVVDFGIAKIKADRINAEEAGLTRTGGMLGSPLYMAPEQAKGRKTIDHRADIWSLGVVLYQALTGQTPHPVESLAALILAICLEPAPPIQDVAPWVPPEIALLVHRSLAIDPEARFPSVSAMLEAIRQVVPDGLSVHANALVPVTEAQQAYVAPRAILSQEMTRAPLSSVVEVTSPLGTSLSGGEAGLSVSQGAAPSSVTPARSLLVPALALSALVGGGALVGYKLVVRDPAPAPSSGLVVAALPPAVTSSPPTVTPASASDERTVRLTVAPADATVEVDDLELPVKDGAVELRGAVGSVHRVRLRKGTQETVAEVAITLSGVVPPKVQIGAAALKPSSTYRPAASSSGAAAKGPKDPTKPKDPAFTRQFE